MKAKSIGNAIAAAVLTFCVVGAEGASAQATFEVPDNTKQTGKQPSTQPTKSSHKSGWKQQEQISEEKTKSVASTNDCSKQKTMQAEDKIEGDPSASQNIVEFGGGG